MKYILIPFALLFFLSAPAQEAGMKLRKKDRRKDVAMVTDSGTIILRLSDSTPLHRDNFLRLVKQEFYDGVLFHRVIRNFMIQSGDPLTRDSTKKSEWGNGGPSYIIPAEFRPGLFHQRGVLAAARTGDDVNPRKESSASQFYIVQGRKFSPAGLDSVETFRLKGRKIPEDHRKVYETLGGAPHLDQNYTVFGEVVSGMDVVDRIAATATTGKEGGDRPLKDIHIRHVYLIKKKKYRPSN